MGAGESGRTVTRVGILQLGSLGGAGSPSMMLEWVHQERATSAELVTLYLVTLVRTGPLTTFVLGGIGSLEATTLRGMSRLVRWYQ